MEWVFRFLLGGAIVSLFATAGELFKPKTFSGLFGTAPSVAIASLALAYHEHDARYVGLEARAMVLGAIAMLAYCVVCVVVTAREHAPEWLSIAGVAWLAWAGVAFALFAIVVGRSCGGEHDARAHAIAVEGVPRVGVRRALLVRRR